MPDSTLDILIRAQQQTQAAFEAARKDLAGLKDESKKTNDTFSLLKSGLGALGIAFTAVAVVGFAKDILDAAGNVSDLAAGLGISTDAVQDFKASAEDSGATIDNVAQAIQKLNDEAASGAIGFSNIGLSLEKIQAMSPEERFREVANALKAIEDPAERARRGHDLLGKSYDALAASIENGIGSMEASNKMSEETIATLDNLGDSIGHVWTATKNFAGTVLASSVDYYSKLVSETVKGFHTLFEALHLDTTGLTNDVNDLIDRFKILRDGVTNLPKAPSAPDLFKGTAARKPTALNKEEEEQIVDALNKERKALDETSKAIDKHADSIKKLQDQIFGRNLITAAKDYVEALGKMSNLSKVSAEEQKKLNDAAGKAIDAYKRLGQTAPAALIELYNRTVVMPEAVDGIADSVKNLGREVDVVIPQLYEMPKAIAFTPAALREIEIEAKTAIPEIPKQIKIAHASISDLSRAFTELATIAGGSLSSVVRDLGSLVAAASTAKTSIDLIKNAGKEGGKDGGKFQAFLDMTSGIMGIVSAALQAGKAIANLLDRNKGRDLIVDFAEQFGGLNELHKLLAEQLPEDAERFWVLLTQGVGRNNPQQAQAAIDQVTAALDKQAKKQDDVQDQTEESALATIETATEATRALDLVGERLETNKGQWSDWSSAVMNEIAKVASAVGAVVVPAPSGGSGLPGFAGGTHGAYLDFGAGTPVMLHRRERIMTEAEGQRAAGGLGGTVIVQVDGREIARTNARYQRQVLAPYGVR